MARDFDADDLFFASVADRNLTEARERHDQAVSQKRAADDDLIQKRAGESKAKAAQARADLETAQSREQPTASQAQRLDGLFAPLVVDGPLNGELFREYVREHLAPRLRGCDVLVVDNLATHKVAGVAEAVAARGARALYLPPYSPDLNPIERWPSRR